MRARTPEIVVLGVLVLLLALGVAGGGDKKTKLSATAKHVALVARRVEQIRGLRFKEIPKPVVLSAAEVRREGLADQARTNPPAQRRKDEELLKLLRLIGPRDDLGTIAGSIYGEQVAGFYDPRRKRLALVAGSGGGALDDVTLAHELTHALEDQNFHIKDTPPGTDDAASARTALIEGSATEVMVRYARRYVGALDALSGALASGASLGDAAKLPPYVEASLLFPYFAGERFVQALVADGRDTWRLVDNAERFRPPASTAQVIHPALWLKVVQPVPVRVESSPGEGWRRLSRGGLGEFDTSQLLQRAIPAAQARDAADGWAGGQYALWRRGPLPAPGCAAPCRRNDALVLAWVMRDPREAGGLAAGFGLWLAKQKLGPGAALTLDGARVRLVLAPDARLAARLSR